MKTSSSRQTVDPSLAINNMMITATRFILTSDLVPDKGQQEYMNALQNKW